MRNARAKFYLYKGSTIDDSGVPIEEPLKSCEAEDVYQAAQECIKDLSPDMNPEIDEFSKEEGWARISIKRENGEEILELCDLNYADLADA